MRMILIGGAFALGLLAGPSAGNAHESHKQQAGTGASYAFPIAPPGSYRLPPIKRAVGGTVLDEKGHAHDLRDLFVGRTIVLAFIYTRCGDVCPVASLDMSLLQDLAAKDPQVASRLRLITMSFDPEHDTPEVMRDYAAQWRSADREAPEWLFLTARSTTSLAPMLAGYNQTIDRKPDEAFNHIFRAFLIDRYGRSRNIYSLDFFDPQLVLNDVRTLLLENRGKADSTGAQ
jgi:cytochrome c peroxidase/protein SCO1/2